MRSVFSVIVGCLMAVAACNSETVSETTVTVEPVEVVEAPLPETAPEAAPTVDAGVVVQPGDTPTAE